MYVPTLCRNAIEIAQPCKPDSVWFRPKSERGDNLSKALDFSRARAALPSTLLGTNPELVERRGLAPSKDLAVSLRLSVGPAIALATAGYLIVRFALLRTRLRRAPQPFRVSASLFAPLPQHHAVRDGGN
jgi:hypothetical protein